MDRIPVTTTNLAAEKAAALLKLFPECAGERGEVDFEKLKQTLADHVIEGDVERYQFTWPGKRAAMAEANVPTTKTLAPCEEESVDFAKTQNLYIEGDNLEVLKILRASYLGQVKMIYIDPPYNTGHDFVYHDRFAITQEEADQRGGNVDDLGRRFTENSESNPRYHSDWCSMMYPRLKLARDLLRDDGVIFISLDSNEMVNVHKLCDEIFGSSNFISDIIVENNPRGRQSDSFIATAHEYLICYARDIAQCVLHGEPLSEDQKSEYSLKDEQGAFRLLGLRQRGVASLREDRPDMFFPVYVNRNTLEISLDRKEGWEEVLPKKSDGRDGRWMWGRTKCSNEIYRLVPRLIERRNEFDIFVKDYLSHDGEARTRKYKTVWADKILNNQVATQEVKALLGGDYMSFPKSRGFVKMIAQLGSEGDSLILDFFSGSATTAHAVMQLNAEDGGHRKFILVQLPEVCAEGSEAAKAGYKNICEIGKERIRRAGKKIVEELKSKNSHGDTEARRENTSKSKNGEVDLFAAAGGAAGVRALPENPVNPVNPVETNLRGSVPPCENDLDVGFRVLKLVDSPMVDASKPAGETTQAELSFSSVKDGVKDDALLFHTMLRLGIAPTDTIEYKTIEGNKVACVGGAQLVAALDARTQMTNAFIEAIAKMNPGVVVFRDDTFRNNNALRISLEQTFKQLSRETKIEVI